MAKKDWLEVIEIFNTLDLHYIDNFIKSNNNFCPNNNFTNIFDKSKNAFSAKSLNKSKPGNWIPIYKKEDLSDYLIKNNLMPIRCGQGEFFFFKGQIYFDLKDIEFISFSINNLISTDDFIPLTLKDFHKNENAYLNKALAIGIINHFVDNNNLSLFKRDLNNKTYRRLLYGQFGKIKTNFELEFKTKYGSKTINKGFQFEIDLVLENKDEIIIFEAKQGKKERTSFSLLQLYYPLIYLYKITNNKKKIRTIFIDIISNSTTNDIYKLTEFYFKNCEFDNYKILKSYEYS